MTSDLLQALALVIVIEGLAYALFPNFLKRMMRHAQSTPDPALRLGGLIAIAVGVAGVWLERSL